MKTLQEDTDDLDRMVDTGAQKDAIRSQIRLVSREVDALQAGYVSLAQTHAKLQEIHLALDAKLAALVKKNRDAGWDALRKQSDDYHKMLRSKQLNYDA